MNKMVSLMGRGKWVFLAAALAACGGIAESTSEMGDAAGAAGAMPGPKAKNSPKQPQPKDSPHPDFVAPGDTNVGDGGSAGASGGAP